MSPSPNEDHQGIPPNAGAVFANAFLKTMGKQLPSSQVKRGDDKLKQTRDLITPEVQSKTPEDDLKVIEDQITYAREMKVGLDTKSGIPKYLHAREYHKVTNRVLQHTKLVSDRVFDQTLFQSQAGTSSERQDIYRRVMKTARSLYRCWLSCKDAFPSSDTKDKWFVDVWNEACSRTEAHPISLREDEEFKCSSMQLLTDMKTKIEHVVKSSYGFDTSQASKSISRNTSRAQALLAKTSFIYPEVNSIVQRRYPYRHPIIQEVINITWFQDKDDIGIIFYEYFAPIPFEVIALAATVIECCIDEWSTGTRKQSSWKEGRYKANYFSHLNALRDLDSHGQQGRDVLRQIQNGVLKAARVHAGVPPDPPSGTMGSGRLSLDALDAAVRDVDLPDYDQVPVIRFPCQS